MISIVISEKGGAERREYFDRNEVTIGRIKGNDVLLPKGNVSKRHARLLWQENRFVVTDLKSTNGTYVNHQRIGHATLVSEQDRIYIGDFVLRVEKADANAPLGEAPAPFSTSRRAQLQADEWYDATGRITASNAPLSHQAPATVSPDALSRSQGERAPQGSAPAAELPGPPPLPGEPKAPTAPHPTARSAELPSSQAPPSPQSGAAARPASGEPLSGGAAIASSGELEMEQRRRSERQQRLRALVEGAQRRVDLAALDREAEVGQELAEAIATALDEELAEQLQGAPLPPHLDERTLAEAARRELCELGPLGPLMDDDKNTRIQVVAGKIVVLRNDLRARYQDFDFSGEKAVERALRRLCVRAGAEPGPDERYLERRLPGGHKLFAVLPPAASHGHLLVISRPIRSETSLDALVRSGAISRSMATVLAHCVRGQANILVSGSAGAGTASLARALAGAADDQQRAIWLVETGEGEHLPSNVAGIELGRAEADRLQAIDAAARLGPDLLLVPSVSGLECAKLLEAVTAGSAGVILQSGAPTLVQAVARLGAAMAGVHAGLSPQTARQWLGSAFDIGIEASRQRDGRTRVARLAEFQIGAKGTTIRDVFTFAHHRTAAGGSIEGTFYPTGVVPHIVETLAARGMPLDTSVFRRHPSAGG